MIITSKEYNRLDMQKYHNRVSEWKKENSHNIIPQIAFYGFRKRNGELKNYGYVLIKDGGAYWRKTKKELLSI